MFEPCYQAVGGNGHARGPFCPCIAKREPILLTASNDVVLGLVTTILPPVPPSALTLVAYGQGKTTLRVFIKKEHTFYTMPNTLETRRIYYGDNLPIMRDLPTQSVDLIYLDPPFNSKRNYNMPLTDDYGKVLQAQAHVFTDTWEWEQKHHAQYLKTIEQRHHPLAHTLKGVDAIIRGGGVEDHQKSGAFAYLVHMAVRLLEMHRLLKPTGSLYLHCDPTMSHYLKILLDAVFGVAHFRNEIAWKRYATHSLSQSGFDSTADTIFLYRRSKSSLFVKQYETISSTEIQKKFSHYEKETQRYYQHIALEQAVNYTKGDEIRIIEGRKVETTLGWRWSQKTFDQRIKKNPHLIYWTKNGRPRYKKYLDEYEGMPLGTIWTDIPYLSAGDGERVGYPTQKPLALLERIIKASSNAGEVVFDPFCGCGTAILAAEQLGRQWIGIDITYHAVKILRERFEGSKTSPQLWSNITVIGEPYSPQEALVLAELDKHEFEKFAVKTFGGSHSGKKGSDDGVDGYFTCYPKKTNPAPGSTRETLTQEGIIQVKGGKVGNWRQTISALHNDANGRPAVLITAHDHPAARSAAKNTQNVWVYTIAQIMNAEHNQDFTLVCTRPA